LSAWTTAAHCAARRPPRRAGWQDATAQSGGEYDNDDVAARLLAAGAAVNAKDEVRAPAQRG
jgi:hypothetical protein